MGLGSGLIQWQSKTKGQKGQKKKIRGGPALFYVVTRLILFMLSAVHDSKRSKRTSLGQYLVCWFGTKSLVAWPWLGLGLALALAWPWLALGLPLAWPWLALGLVLVRKRGRQ